MSTFDRNAPLFDDSTILGMNLSEEARTITLEASTAMRTWIDDSIKKIDEAFQEKANNALKELEKAQADTAEVLEAENNKLTELAKKLETLTKNLESFSPSEKATIEQLNTGAASIKEELEKRKGMAARAAQMTVTAIKSATGTIAAPA